eukprot:g14978.t1
MLRRQKKSRPEVLPAGWEAKKWKKKTVYVNHVTKQTQWEKPKMPDPPTPNVAPSNRSVQSSASTLPGHVAMVDGPVRRRGDPHSGKHVVKADGPVRKREDTTHSGEHVVKADGPDDDGYRRSSTDEDKRREARSRPSTDASQGLRGNGKPSSSGAPSSSTSRSTRHERNEEPNSPLPRGWSEAFTQSGKRYYRNHFDQTTTWERPTEAATRPTDATSSNSDGISGPTEAPSAATNLAPLSSLPPGWSKAVTKNGETYYRNDYDQTTTWEKPTEAATRPVVTHLAPLSPLPAGWSKAVTKNGETYYRNDYDQTTTWDKPKEAATRPAVTHSAPLAPLPAGWSEAFTQSGKRYYRNHIDQTTTWERPTEAAPSRVVAVNGSDGGKRESKEQKSPPAENKSGGQQEQPLPPGWSQAVTDNGETYYRNHTDQTTSWDRPVLAPANPRPDVARSEAPTRNRASAVRDRLARALRIRPGAGQQTGVPVSLPGVLGGIFANVEGLAAGAPESPKSTRNKKEKNKKNKKTKNKKNKKNKKKKNQERSFPVDIAGIIPARDWSEAIMSGMEAAGVKGFVEEEKAKDKKRGEAHKVHGKEIPGSGTPRSRSSSSSGSDSDSSEESGEEEGGELDTELDFTANAADENDDSDDDNDDSDDSDDDNDDSDDSDDSDDNEDEDDDDDDDDDDDSDDSDDDDDND